MFGGGMVPVCTLRTTFSQISGCAAGIGDVDRFEHQLRGLDAFVVTADAVSIEELPLIRLGSGARGGWRRGLLRRRVHAHEHEQDDGKSGQPKGKLSAERERLPHLPPANRFKLKC